MQARETFTFVFLKHKQHFADSREDGMTITCAREDCSHCRYASDDFINLNVELNN